jgi:hypothetical protein
MEHSKKLFMLFVFFVVKKSSWLQPVTVLSASLR